MSFLRISLLLCTYGFFREMRPSEPFVVEYLSGDWSNLTEQQVNQEIYPLGTYSVLSQLVIVFLITDILRYKPLIVISALAGMALFALLLWFRTILELQIAQIFYGTFTASEVAYYTYIYAKVDKDKYQLVTGHTRSAILCGKFIAAVLAQLLVSTNTMDIRELNYITLGSQVVSLFIALALPPVQQSVYFYTANETLPAAKIEDNGTVETATETDNANFKKKPNFSWRNAAYLLWQHTISAYSNRTVVKWSLWWAFATCGQIQVTSYAQFLWKDIDSNGENFYNGAVEAIVTLVGAIAAMTAGTIDNKRSRKWHMWILTACTLLMGAFLIISATTKLIWVAYTMYIFFGIVYFFVITIASAIVAENLCDDSFGLIFGINTLVALLLQTVLILLAVTDTAIGYALNPRQQFVVYGSYFLGLAALYFIGNIIVAFCRRSHLCFKSNKTWKVEQLQGKVT